MPRHKSPLFSTLSFALMVSLGCATHASADDLWQSYELARASDPQLQLAETQKKTAEEGIRLARSSLLPQISASAGYSYGETSRPALDQLTREVIGQNDDETDTKTYGLNATQTLYDHANYTRLREARARAKSAQASYRAAEQALLVRVANAYFAVLTAQDSVSSAQAEEKAVGRQLDQAEQRFNVGLTAITDVHEARARHDGAVAAAILAENALDDAKAALTEITGKAVNGVASVRETIPLVAPEPADWQAWVETAVKNSPTIAARLADTETTESQIATAKSARYPTLSSSFRFNDQSSGSRVTVIRNLGQPGQVSRTDSETDGSTISIDVSIPLFTGFATSSRIRQAVYESEASKDRLEQETRAVTRQTRNAYRSVIAGVSEVKARAQALVSAKSALEATEAGFEVGTRTIVDVLLSQQVLYQAQRDYSQARHNFLVNGLRLKSSAGTITPEDLKTVNELLVPNNGE